MEYIVGNQRLRTLLFFMVVMFSISSAQSQSCASASRNSYEWPGHNNWFLPALSPSDGSAHVLNQRTGVMTNVVQPDWSSGLSPITSIRGFEAISTASNDNGDLVFFTNGRKAWKANGTLITDGLLGGNECGAMDDRGGTANGVMVLRHPLQPLYYYVVNIDDIVNQSCTNSGVTVAIIDSAGNLVQNSEPMEKNITLDTLGKIRTTESIAATMHGNGVDIWVTVQPLDVDYFASYLLTSGGFVTAPVLSNAMIQSTSIFQGIGDLSYSWDGTMFACGVQVNTGDVSSAPYYGHGTINLYDFDNNTGLISNRKAIHHSQWGSLSVVNVLFSTDGSELHYSGATGAGKYTLTGTTDEIRASHGTTTLSGGYNSASTDYQGNMISRDSLGNQYSEIGGASEFGMNRMFIPPVDEPEIQPVSALCDTGSTMNLQTRWICAGVSAEDTVSRIKSQYSGTGILDSGSGIFDPKVAGAGQHEIIFSKAGVNDTITIEVAACGPVSISQMEGVFVNIQPNPIYDIVSVIVQGDRSVLIELNGLDGSIVTSVVSDQKVNRLDLVDLTAGIYILKVTFGSGEVVSRKVVKL